MWTSYKMSSMYLTSLLHFIFQKKLNLSLYEDMFQDVTKILQ
jgi:hypothetical protein